MWITKYHRYAVVVQDFATQQIQWYPCKRKTSQETQKSLQKFLEPTRKPKVIYTDNSLEFGWCCQHLSWNHSMSKPHRSDTNGIAERAVRRIKEGTSAFLLQSGLDEKWWADSMECYLRNNQDVLSDGKTPCERRFGVPFNGPIIPLGAMVENHPISAEDPSRLHQFGPKVLTGIFLGHALHAGRIWKEDILVADIEELELMDASEIHAKRLNAKELFQPKNGEKNRMPNRRWNGKTFWRRSGSENIRRTRQSWRRIRRIFFNPTSRLIVVRWWSKKLFLVHFQAICPPSSRGTQSQTVRAERRIISYSTEIHRSDQDFRYIQGCNAGDRTSMTIGTLM